MLLRVDDEDREMTSGFSHREANGDLGESIWKRVKRDWEKEWAERREKGGDGGFEGFLGGLRHSDPKMQ